MNLFGYGAGPWVAGLLSDLLGGENSLRYALTSLNVVMLWAGVHYAIAARSYRRDLAARTES